MHNTIHFTRLYGLVEKDKLQYAGRYSKVNVTEAVRQVIDAYTFFDDADDKVSGWSKDEGTIGHLQRFILNEYTTVIPTVMREVI